MKSPSVRSLLRSSIALLTFSLAASTLFGGPTRKNYGYYPAQAIGLRLGWSGAPNGLTYRKVIAPNQAIEFVAGYNHKEGRTLNAPFYRKGSSIVEMRYAPFSMASSHSSNLAVGFNLDVGAGLRYHHARPFENNLGAKKVTPEVLAGAGIQVEISEKVQLFTDLHARYYNRITNAWTWILETGAGIRVALGD